MPSVTRKHRSNRVVTSPVEHIIVPVGASLFNQVLIWGFPSDSMGGNEHIFSGDSKCGINELPVTFLVDMEADAAIAV